MFGAINRVLLIALAVTVLLLGLSGWYLKVQIGKVGELEGQIDNVIQANQTAFETIDYLKAELDAQAQITADAAKAKAHAQQTANALQRRLQEALQHDS